MLRPTAWKTWAQLLLVLCAVLLAWGAAGWLIPKAALAQEPPADAAAAAAPAAATAPATPKRQNYLQFFFGALGWRYTIAFLVISFTFVAFLVMNLLSLRRDSVCPRHLSEVF